MTIEQAIELLIAEYERAQKLAYVRKPVAYALYQVWKMADRKRCSNKRTAIQNLKR